MFEAIMTEFPQINVRHQTIDPPNSEIIKYDKCKKITTRHIIFKLQKIKDKEKYLERSWREKKTLLIEEQI